ncbi:MAG TPA: hypothetical protein VGI32_05875 [Steroidobacteraceae bacterium]
MLQRLALLRFSSGTSILGHGDEALTLAAVHALAAILRGFAVRGTLAGIYALTLHGGGIACKRSRADRGSEQHGGCSGHGSARQFIDLHFLIPSIVLERSGIAAQLKDPANTLIITEISKLMPVSIGRQRVPAGGQTERLK